MTLALFDISGDVAVVTGAGRGIGRGIAIALAQAGANVVCAARRADEIEETAKLINMAEGDGGKRAIAVPTDVTDEAAMDALAQAAVDAFGRLDIWVNNAGGSPAVMAMTELPVEEWRRTLDVNLTSVFFGVRAAARHMSNGGRILNISSMASRDIATGSVHYSAAKAGVNMLTRTVSHELGPRIRINSILPGFVPTETVKIALNMTDEDFVQLEKDLQLPAGRLGTPEDIGALALYLCSPASAWMTGQNIAISGKA